MARHALLKLVFSLICFSGTLLAAYDPHDGSEYSCNELRNIACYEKMHAVTEKEISTAIKSYKEYKKYCSERIRQELRDELQLNKGK